MEDGHYRLVSEDRKSRSIVEVYGDAVADSHSVLTDSPVSNYLARGCTFTRVYPIHLPDEMMEWVHSQALMANISDDDVIEEAIRRFILSIKKGEN